MSASRCDASDENSRSLKAAAAQHHALFFGRDNVGGNALLDRALALRLLLFSTLLRCSGESNGGWLDDRLSLLNNHRTPFAFGQSALVALEEAN